MVTSVTAIAVAAGLLALHTYIRRHPAWAVSARARYCFNVGYPMMAIAVYFVVGSPALTGSDWIFGLGWAAAAVASFATGFSALRHVLRRQRRASLSMETLSQTAAV